MNNSRLHSKFTIVLAVVLFASLGVVLVYVALAAPYVSVQQAEDGQLSGGAFRFQDTEASQGEAVIFTAAPEAPAPQRVVAYYPNWSLSYYQPSDLHPNVTHANYAFADISGNGCIINSSRAETFLQLRTLRPDVQTTMSIAGPSADFSAMANSFSSRQSFVQSCVQLMAELGFNGIDVDWEFPTIYGGAPEDTQNYTLLLQELRSELDRLSGQDDQQYLLTAAHSINQLLQSRYELSDIHQYLDWFNLMAYDLAGRWDGQTGLHSALHSGGGTNGYYYSSRIVDTLVGFGVPRDKIVFGVPFYGRSWGCVADVDNGLFQVSTCNASGPGIHSSSGASTYRSLRIHQTGLSGYSEHWDEQTRSAYLYSPNEEIFISFDSPRSIRARAQYVADNSLGGIMIWSIDQDNGELMQELSN